MKQREEKRHIDYFTIQLFDKYEREGGEEQNEKDTRFIFHDMWHFLNQQHTG